MRGVRPALVGRADRSPRPAAGDVQPPHPVRQAGDGSFRPSLEHRRRAVGGRRPRRARRGWLAAGRDPRDLSGCADRGAIRDRAPRPDPGVMPLVSNSVRRRSAVSDTDASVGRETTPEAVRGSMTPKSRTARTPCHDRSGDCVAFPVANPHRSPWSAYARCGIRSLLLMVLGL